ncbi:MAG: METTL5 family protein [Nitrososphaerota archaeon]|nr:METTL5 family protein [Candidatus Bathyarchaeota archaeon]MCX8161475.1 METTL5 family protein [Candidatus Bathyarchaeota archaeon]MDW8061706.1 METTL5 family protein [Nitrososphaerota archaeon]
MNFSEIPNWKKIEIDLSRLASYPKPKPSLEQYPTPVDLAVKVLRVAYLNGDIYGRVVLDLGCGTGILSIGAALLGAYYVIGVDIDRSALETASMNAETLDVSDTIDWVQADVASLNLKCKCDTVVQNPPFGVQRRGADRIFLFKALKTGRVVYSMHKSGTDEFIKSYVEKCGGRIEAIYVAEIEIPYLFSFHRKPRHSVKINVYKVVARHG